MNEAAYEQHNTERESDEQLSMQDRETGAIETTEIKVDDTGYLESNEEMQDISSDIERIASLSAEMNRLLSNLSHKIERSALQLKEIQSAIDTKKEELQKLHEIDASITSLETLIEDHRLENERFQTLMDNQRGLWEEEKNRRVQEEEGYFENLRIRREQEEEEYRRTWDLNKSEAHEKLGEELRTIESDFRKKLEASEKDLLDRESILGRKEKEWNEIVRETEQFLSGLSNRIQGSLTIPVGVTEEEPQQSPASQDTGDDENSVSLEERGALTPTSGSEADSVEDASPNAPDTETPQGDWNPSPSNG
jgi:hypothetical protein